MEPGSGQEARVIDVHAHAVLELTLGAAGAPGPEIGALPDGTPFYRVGAYTLRGVTYAGTAFMENDVRLAAMDQAGIDVQLLSPNPLTYFGRLEAGRAAAYARAHNDALAARAAEHPGRLLAAAQLPVQDIAAAVAEARRAVRDLGMVAAYIDTDPAGRALDNAELDPLYDALTDLDVPLFVHPSPLGADGPPDDPRVRRWDLDLMFGFARDETLAVAALIFGGVLERHPGLDVCVSHGGGAAAFLAGRFDRAVQKRAWASRRLRENGFAHYYRQLWFDTHVHDDLSLRLLADRVGTERLVFGTNFAGWDSGAGHDPGPDALALAANGARLLRLGRRAGETRKP